MKRKIPILSRLLFLIRHSPWLWCDHLHICSKSLSYRSRVKYCNDAFKNTLTNVTCETLYRLHTPRPTWFGAFKKKKKVQLKTSSSNWGVGLQGLCWWDKEKAFLHAFLPPGTHLLCALLNKGISQFRRGRRESVVATGPHRAGFPPQKVKYKQKAKNEAGILHSPIYWRKHQGIQC